MAVLTQEQLNAIAQQSGYGGTFSSTGLAKTPQVSNQELGVLSSNDFTNQQDIKLSPLPQDDTNYRGLIDGGKALVDALNTKVETPDLQTLYSTLYGQSGIGEQQTKALESQKGLDLLNAQMASLSAEAQAVPIQIQQEYAGRGATKAGVAPIETARLRDIALRSLPLQGQILAQQAVATGDQRALAAAQQKFETAFTIASRQAEMQYTARREQRDRIYDYLTKAEQRQVDARNKADERQYQQTRDSLNFAQGIAKTAIENGQADLAAQIFGLNPSSKTYQQDVAQLAGQIRPKVAPTTPTPAPAAPNQMVLATNKANVDLISNLATDKYLTSAVGPNKLARVSFSNLFTGGKSNFIAGVEQIRSQLNLDALIQAKAQGATFGALSDQELRVLASSASKIGTWAQVDPKTNQVTGYKASEADFRRELDKINNFAKLDYILKGGDPTEVGATITEDGKIWAVNSDGTYTQIK